MQYLVGTSGWSYPSGPGKWIGLVYSSGQDELDEYSKLFNFVEVNSTFYRPQLPETAGKWIEKTPADFIFAIKLWQKFTHPTMYTDATNRDPVLKTKDVDLVKKFLDPLHEKKRLGPLIAQFPPSFHDSDESRDRLSDIISDFKDYPLAVEVRHRSWTDTSYLADYLNENRVSWIRNDEPKFSSSVEENPITGNFAYLRLHGRNKSDWWKKDDREARYNYLYSQEELKQIRDLAQEIAHGRNIVYIAFNNHPGGKSVVNALQLKQMLGQPVDQQKLDELQTKLDL